MQTGNSGSTSTGLSSATADLNTIATTNTLALRIMGIQDDPANSDFTAAGIPLIVRINNHFNAPTGSIAAGYCFYNWRIRRLRNMAISRAQLAKELEPGLNALFGIRIQSVTKTSIPKSLMKKVQTELLKKK